MPAMLYPLKQEACISVNSFDAGINMFVKMKKKVFPCVIMGCSLAAMLLISIFAWTFSSVFLMLIAAVASLVIFIIQGAPSEKGGERN